MSRQKLNQIRIIGGQLRGRKLTFPDRSTLRPTPDRVRETLFNWLAPTLSGRRVLDLFSGSGALGIEAISRGAASLFSIESDRTVFRDLESNLLRLNLECSVQRLCGDGVSWIKKSDSLPFDLVFVDPPYHLNLLPSTLSLLAEKLPQDALIYWEHPTEQTAPTLPSNLKIIKEKRAAKVYFYLGTIISEESEQESEE